MISRVRHTPGGVDEYGDPITSSPSTTELVGAFTAPRDAVGSRESSEINQRGRAGVIVGLTLYAPYGTDLRRDDQVDIDGTLFDVEGEVGSWRNPFTSWEAGIEVALRRATG